MILYRELPAAFHKDSVSGMLILIMAKGYAARLSRSRTHAAERPLSISCRDVGQQARLP
jgi:hypothetical protein